MLIKIVHPKKYKPIIIKLALPNILSYIIKYIQIKKVINDYKK